MDDERDDNTAYHGDMAPLEPTQPPPDAKWSVDAALDEVTDDATRLAVLAPQPCPVCAGPKGAWQEGLYFGGTCSKECARTKQLIVAIEYFGGKEQPAMGPYKHGAVLDAMTPLRRMP